MGKTVQAISVVMADREAALAARAAQAAAQASRKGKEKEMDPATTKVGPTLVVCPTVAIIQWRGEIGIDSMSDESSPRVGVLDRRTCDLFRPDGVLSHCDRRFRH